METSTHYALVNAGSNPVIIPDGERNDPREELSQIYQKYAELYPNPRLVEEHRMKNELLQATSAAASAQQGSTPRRTPRGGGLFDRIFGGGGTSKPSQVLEQEEQLPEETLVYRDIPNEDDDGSMCGTRESLDRSCIPLEAMSVARFHLTSQATRGNHPNAVRWGPLLGRSVPTSLVVVGLGMIAELQPNKVSTILSTSDRAALMDYSRVHPGEFRVEYVRACGISPNCIAVSWGFLDGMVAIYRRIHFPNDERCGWEQLWLVQPSPPVLEASRDIFHDDEALPGSPLLRVADLLPLRVVTGDRGQPMVATLAVARLGCHLELLPIPTDLWFGPLLTPENHKRPRIPKRKPGQHYSFGKYIGSPTVALTTGDHQLDILSMEALRTTVGVETVWNQQSFPDGPPSEFIVALSGLSRESPDLECITFWTVCTLFPDPEEIDNQHQALGFELHSTFLQSTLLSTGPEVTVFATPEIMKHWRMPRHVELRSDAHINGDSYDNVSEVRTQRVTTISTPAPIVLMQFREQKGSSLLAVLDWNGGTTLFDCSPMERTAAQALSWGELARLDLAAEEGKPKPPMLRVVVSRSQFSSAIGYRNKVGVLQWLNVDASETQTNYDDSCSLVLLLRNEKNLLVASFDIHTEEGQGVEEHRHSIVSLSFPGDGATMGVLGRGNVLFVSKTREGEDSYKLKFFVMQNLPPAAIVESLAREAKYEDAIAAAKSLPELDQDTVMEVVEECHRRLWETKRDIDHLADTRNISYVVDQAVAICESTSDENREMSFDNLRLLCQLAVAMGRNHEPAQDSIRKLGGFLMRLGTYELLCRCCATPPHLDNFFGEFQQYSISELGMSLAERGDIPSLSVVIFRHRSELLESIFPILSRIPPSTDLQTFVHLIPVLKNGRATDTFLASTVQCATLHISQMPQHLKDAIGIRLVLDASDERMVLEHNALDGTEAGSLISTSQIVGWFECRCANVQDFVGDLRAIIRVCEVGMWCIGFDFTKSTVPFNELQQLFKIWRGAKSLYSILLGDFLALDSNEESKTSSAVVVSINDLLSMELPDVVDLILGEESDFSRIRTRCSDYLQPLLLELNRDDTRDAAAGFDSVLSSYCSGLVDECLTLSRQDATNKRLLMVATKGFGVCSMIAGSSMSSIRKQDRLVKDTGVLIELVVNAIRGMALALEATNIPFSLEREFVEAMWVLYEALPDQVPSSMPHGDKLLPLVKSLDDLLLDLTCVDILSRWPGSKPISFLARRRQDGINFDDRAGADFVVRICRVFVTNLRVLKSREKQSELLQDLLSDVQQVNMLCCQGSLHLPELLSENLVVALLESEYFALVLEYCRSDSSLVDEELVMNDVLSFIDEAVFSDYDNGNRAKAAMKCQDIVGPAFPGIQHGLADMRRYLDAVHFMTTVLYEGRPNRPIRPNDLREQLHFDTIESILQDKPVSVLCGCPQWQDITYAVAANETLRSASSTGQLLAEPEIEMPVLPGGAIFHLATILGLEDENAALAVKCRVIHYALSIGIHGAAAAVCRTLVGPDAAEFEDDAVALAKLGAVAQVVCESNYADLETKYELCRAAFVKFSGRLEISNTSMFTKIATTLMSLDQQRSRHNRDTLSYNQEKQKNRLSRPLSRLQRHILAEYNADVHGLFSDLIKQTSIGMVHDSLMNALSRFVIYWCVSDSKMRRAHIVMSEKNDTIENWALGCSLILHIPSRLTAGNCVHELQKIVADQVSMVSSETRFRNDDICVPNPDIVARMIHRGYSEAAARRAVIMTQNAGYDEALRWAFAHTHEQDFNEPILVVRDTSRLFVDEGAIQMLQKCLHATQSWVDDAVAMERLRSFFLRQHGEPGKALLQAPIQESAVLHTPHNTSETHVPKSKYTTPATKISTVPPKLPTPKPLATVATKPPPSKSRVGDNSLQSQNELDAKPSRAPKGALPIAAMHESRLPRNGTSETSPSKPRSPVDAKFPSRLASPRDAGDARLALLKRGQEALSKRRTNGETPDRMKLIANGRELLRKSRASKVSPDGTVPQAAQGPNPKITATFSEGIQAHQEPQVQIGRIEDTEEAIDSNSEGSGWDFDDFDNI